MSEKLPKNIEEALERLEDAVADPMAHSGPNGEPAAPDCTAELNAARRALETLILEYGRQERVKGAVPEEQSSPLAEMVAAERAADERAARMREEELAASAHYHDPPLTPVAPSDIACPACGVVGLLEDFVGSVDERDRVCMHCCARVRLPAKKR